jgi:UDP-N-acetylmuramate dehydrogenase
MASCKIRNIEEMKYQRNYNLLTHNTFGLDVNCSEFFEFNTEDELKDVVSKIRKGEITKYLVIGAGSNVLFTSDYSGLILHSAIKGVDVIKEDDFHVYIRVGSGETWDDIVDKSVCNDWHGAENLSLIPGEVGASAVQNIGAYGAEAKDLIYEVEAMNISTGEIERISNKDCAYSYRQSRFKNQWKGKYIVTYVTYVLSKQFTPRLDYGNIRAELDKEGVKQPNAVQLRQTIIKIRRAKLPDPQIEGNAGSFFMNPVIGKDKYNELASLYPTMPHYTVDDLHEKIPAGWMIDQCGWKGKSLGRVGVHVNQALVLVNHGGATGQELIRLSDTIRRDVKTKFGIEIFPEVNIL